jgi:hypothetical protein
VGTKNEHKKIQGTWIIPDTRATKQTNVLINERLSSIKDVRPM